MSFTKITKIFQDFSARVRKEHAPEKRARVQDNLLLGGYDY